MAAQATDFLDSEYVIYSQDRQMQKYLIEFSLDGDHAFSTGKASTTLALETPQFVSINPQRGLKVHFYLSS